MLQRTSLKPGFWDCSTAWMRLMRREQRSVHSRVSWMPWWFHFHNCSAGKGQEVRVRNPCRQWVRRTVPSDPGASASVGTHAPSGRTGSECMHAQRRSSNGCRPCQLLRKVEGIWRTPCTATGKIPCLHSRRVVYGWFGSPCSPHQRSMALVAPWTFFFAGYFCSNRLA